MPVAALNGKDFNLPFDFALFVTKTFLMHGRMENPLQVLCAFESKQASKLLLLPIHFAENTHPIPK